jgi:hypothetical protein
VFDSGLFLDLLLFSWRLHRDFLLGSCRYRELLSGTGGLKMLVGWLCLHLHLVLQGWWRLGMLWRSVLWGLPVLGGSSDQFRDLDAGGLCGDWGC